MKALLFKDEEELKIMFVIAKVLAYSVETYGIDTGDADDENILSFDEQRLH